MLCGRRSALGRANPPMVRVYLREPEIEPATELEEAQQLAEALERSLVICDAPQPVPPRRRTRDPPRETRYYAVWKVRGTDSARGVWFGPHPECWDALVSLLPGRAYAPGVTKLRRYYSLDAAIVAYESEASRHDPPAPMPPTLHPVRARASAS